MKSSRSKRRRLLQSYIVPRRPDLPATFESLNDDTLTTVLEFVGDKSYQSFGGTNKQCKEVYLSSGMMKKTFLYGYGSLSVIQVRIKGTTQKYFPSQELLEAVGKGIVFYNRKDVLAWALQQLNNDVLTHICEVAAEEGRIEVLKEVWNNVNEDCDKKYVFEDVDQCAASGGKINVLKWVESKALSIINKERCARGAAFGGQLHIIQWLQEERDLELDGTLYYYAARGGGQLHIMKWLREQKVDWDKWTFHTAARRGNLDIIQWLQYEGCPWPRGSRYRVYEEDLKPEVENWLRSNGYGHRIIIG